MNIDIVIKKFIEYSKNYDLKDSNIMNKFHHSFRVMEYSEQIAKSLNLSKEDIELSCIIGLLHDIARYEQWTKYKTYADSESIDHGDLGHDILNEFLESENKSIILKAVKNHNKAKIEDGLDERTLLFCKIVRDADKLDIMKEQCLILTVEDEFIEDNIIECFYNRKLITNQIENKKTDFNEVLRHLAFIYDINFKYSFDFILKNNIIENKINLLDIYSKEDDKLMKIKTELLDYINEKIN